MNKVIFVSLHHRRSPLFEEGIKLLLKDFPVIIQNTGVGSFGEFGLKDKVEYIDSGEQISYDEGLVRFKDILKDKDWDIVHFIDNDCFITDTNYIKQTLNEFNKSDFGFCSYFENGYETEYQGLITEVENQQFVPVIEHPGFKPNPHWENAMMMFKRSTWDLLSKEDLSHGRLCIKALYDKGVKLGVKKREFKLTYSHYGPGWFHVGNLMAYYYMIENLDMSKLNRDSELDQSRIGYFLTQGWGDLPVLKNLEIIASTMGKESCIQAWNKLYVST